MDGIAGLVVLVIIWVVGAYFDRQKKMARRGSRNTPVSPPTPRPAPGDTSHRQGSTLERALRHLNTELSQAMVRARDEAEAKDRAHRRPTQPVEWDGRSLHVTPTRPEPVLVDLDDESVAAADRRVAAAELRNRPRTDADHAKFHDSIRDVIDDGVIKGHAIGTRKPRFNMKEVRRAALWLEILGPPVGMRDEEGR